MKIMTVADRPGWAVDRLSKSISLKYANVDHRYFNAKPERFIDTGLTVKSDVKGFVIDEVKNYDVVVFHLIEAANDVLKYVDKTRQKAIIHIHSEKNYDRDYSMYDAVICPTRYLFEKVNHKNKYLVPYGIDLSLFHYRMETDNLSVGFVGRVAKHKNFHVICKICEEREYKLVGCGYVDDSQYYNHYISSLDQKNLFKWINLLPEKQLPFIYGDMKVYACLSDPFNETGPLPVLEAMASGVPVVSTRVGWAKDYCTDGENILFIDDVMRARDAVKGLMERQELRRRIRSNALRLIQNYSIENYTKRLMEIYEKT